MWSLVRPALGYWPAARSSQPPTPTCAHVLGVPASAQASGDAQVITMADDSDYGSGSEEEEFTFEEQAQMVGEALLSGSLKRQVEELEVCSSRGVTTI